MFLLHESTQRRVCRVAFLLCAVVPALGTFAYVAYALRPWRESDWQRMLERQLHVRTTVEDVVAPRPGVVRLGKVDLLDLRSRESLASLHEVQCEGRGGRRTLSAAELHIEAGRLPALAAACAAWLSSDALPAVDLRVDKLSFVGPAGQSLSLSSVRLKTDERAGQASRIAVHTGPMRLLLEHDERSIVLLETGADQVPAWLLTSLLPSLSHCNDASFTGAVRWEVGATAIDGALRGRFEKVSLDRWVGAGSRHAITGLATVEFDQLQWHGSRVEVSQGRLRVASGIASRSLFSELEQRLFCMLDPRILTSDGELVPFDELACNFQLNAAGLTIGGDCATRGAGCLIQRGGESLVLEPRYANLPVAQLVQLMAEPATSWLPASAEAYDMAGRLPLPGSSSATVAERPHDPPR